jgi:hypothetical protein
LQHCLSVPKQVALLLGGPHLPSKALSGSMTVIKSALASHSQVLSLLVWKNG